MSDEVPQEQESQAKEEPKDFSPGHESKKRKIPWKPAAGFAAVALLFFAAGFMIPKGAGPTGMSVGPVLTAQEAGDKAIDYINDYLLQEGFTAELMSVNESNGLYMIEINITGSTGSTLYPSYVTKDGNLLFVSSVDMSVTPEVEMETQMETTTVPKTDSPNVKMFVMAYCPYGQQAENGLGPAIEAIGLDSIEFEPHFVIYSNYGDGGPSYCFDNESFYCSMHGINELREDIRQMVIWKYWPEKWWAYVDKVNAETSTSTIESAWEGIAESVGLDASEIKEKFDSEALNLLAAESALNDQYGVRGSPTILINDVQYSGGRSAENFKSAICDAFNSPPEGCNETLSATGSTASGSC